MFFKLLQTLESNYVLKVSRGTITIEILELFWYTLAWDNGNKDSWQKYQHSGETISQYFHYVLTKIFL